MTPSWLTTTRIRTQESMSGAFRPISTEYPISFNHRIQINLKSKLYLWPEDLNNFTLYKIPLFLLKVILSGGEIATDFHSYSPLKEILSPMRGAVLKLTSDACTNQPSGEDLCIRHVVKSEIKIRIDMKSWAKNSGQDLT